jgi:hypothetical protein
VDELVAEAFFVQLLNGLHNGEAKIVDASTANLALALMMRGENTTRWTL